MSPIGTRMNNANKFKLGLFSANCSNGLTMTKAASRWTASWENNVKAAQFADGCHLRRQVHHFMRCTKRLADAGEIAEMYVHDG